MPSKSQGYKGKHAADDKGAGAYSPKVEPSAPGKAGTKGPSANRRRGPQHGTGTTKPLSGAAKNARDERRIGKITDAARDYANREAYRRTEGRPSIAGRAVAGAAAGTATGAAVGGPVGAAAGAVVGGAGGALAGRKAKKAYQMAAAAAGGTIGARRIIVAEFLLCMVVVAFAPLTDKGGKESHTAFIKRATAIMGLFFLLGLLSAGGRGPARFAAGFGGIVTVALTVSNRSLFMKIGEIFSSDLGEPAEPEDLPDLGDRTTPRQGNSP